MADDAALEQVKKILTEEVGPALQLDGGTMEVLGLEDGVLRVRLGGVCGSCPSTVMAVVTAVEGELRRRVPQVEYLEAVP